MTKPDNHAKLIRDPRYQAARSLYDTMLAPSWKGRLPADPHIRDNLIYAIGALACDYPGAAEHLEQALAYYTGSKYRATLRGDVERLARSAAREGEPHD